MPPVPRPVGNQRMGGRRVEICPLPAMLPARSEHLEPAILPSAALDRIDAAHWRDALPMPSLPLQLRQLQTLPRALFLAKNGKSRTGDRLRSARNLVARARRELKIL
jgi:hypothetical protein